MALNGSVEELLDRTTEFVVGWLADLLGLPAGTAGAVLPDGAGATGALVKMENGPSGMGGVLIYFVCEDCAVEQARVVKNDGKIMKEKFSIGQYGHIALASDTEGNMIGLHSMK